MNTLNRTKKRAKSIRRNALTVTLIIALIITASIGRIVDKSRASNSITAKATNSDNTLSLVEINDGFGTLLMRSSQHKTIVYVERLYFDYSVLSSLRLRELDCAINITNANGEWAKVGGYVRSEQMSRPNDITGNLTTVFVL